MRKFALLILLFTAYSALAQNPTKLSVTESEEFKDKVKSSIIYAIHTSSSGMTGIVRSAKKDILFDVFDDSMKKTFSTVVESSKKERFVGEVFFGDEIKYFTVEAPKKTERIVYCHTFSIKNKTHSKKLLFETTVEKKQLLFSGQNQRETSFAISPNGQYFAITTDNIKKNSNSYTIRTYNSETLKLEFKQNYQEHAERFYQHNDLSIDDDATVYALGKLFIKGRSQKKKGEANYEFVLNKITKAGKHHISIALEEDQHINSLNISILNNELHLLGFYSEKRVGRIKGGCNFIIDTKGFGVKSNKTYTLPLEVFEDLYGEKRAEKKEEKGQELSKFYVDYVLQDTEGNTYVLAEKFYITETYIHNQTGGYVQTVYHYDDLLILKFDTSGDLSWGRSVYKKALGPSYNAFIKNDELHIILNSGKRLSEKNDGRTKVSRGLWESTALYDFVYSSTGEVSYDKIQDNKGKTFYTPYYGTYENNKFIMSSNLGKKKKFMILK